MTRARDPSSRATALREGDRPFSSDPERAHTMPSRFYHDPQIFELEKEGVFYRNWVYVGHASQLGRSGDYLTARIHEQSVFVIRDRAGPCGRSTTCVRTAGTSCCRGAGTPL